MRLTSQPAPAISPRTPRVPQETSFVQGYELSIQSEISLEIYAFWPSFRHFNDSSRSSVVHFESDRTLSRASWGSIETRAALHVRRAAGGAQFVWKALNRATEFCSLRCFWKKSREKVMEKVMNSNLRTFNLTKILNRIWRQLQDRWAYGIAT